MELWLDTIDPVIIKNASRCLAITGITTNPTILSQAKNLVDDTIKHLLDLHTGFVAVQVSSVDSVEMLNQARRLSRVDPRIIVKIPVTQNGLSVIKELSEENIPTMATAIVETSQYFLAMLAGATYAAPYLKKIEHQEKNIITVLKQMLEISKNNAHHPKIIAASIASKEIVIDCACLNIPAITISPTVYNDLVAKHPQTQECLSIFQRHWEEKANITNSQFFNSSTA